MKHLSKLAAFFVAMVVMFGFASCKGDAKVEYVEKTYAEAVTFTITEGNGGSKNVKLATATEGAVIYYTTDGTVPTAESSVYAHGSTIAVTADTTIKAIAVKDGLEPSPVATALVTVIRTEYLDKTYASAVTFTVTETEAGSGVVTVTMATTTEGAEIYYTTDGSTPTDESPLYESALTVSESKVIKAIAIKSGIENSPVSSVNITIKDKNIYVDKKADETAPANVTNLEAEAKNCCILLTWTDAADEDVYGYEVSYNGTSPINRVVLPVLDSTSMMVGKGSGGCYVSGLTNGTAYTFTVKTVDTSGNKSEGVSVTATPVANSAGASGVMQIVLSASVPQENIDGVPYTGNKSNTKVTVTADITTGSNVTKVVWKKNGSLIAKNLLADANAGIATESSDNKIWTFDIEATDESANGTYTVAAIDEAGREEAEQIIIDNFDFTPPATVMGLTAVYSVVEEKDIVILNWTKPSTADFDHVEITYTYNDGSTNSQESAPVNVTSANKSFTVKTGDEAAAQTYKYFVKSVDKLGNKSAAMPVSVAVVDGVVVGYQFHEVPEYLPVGVEDGTLGKNGTYVYFGDWPQTIKADDVTVDETQTITKGDFTYYRGSDENWYVKCVENAYGNYTYSNGTAVAESSANSTKFFKVEPIKWRVLNPNATGNEKKILLAESILTNVLYYGSSKSRTLNDTTIYANNYKYSNIRAYLNGINNQFVTDGGTAGSNDIDWSNIGFLQGAFTSSAQSLIADTEVDNSARSTNPDGDYNAALWNDGENQYACDKTKDKIFLLSMQEATRNEYGFTAYNVYGEGNSRIRVTTDYAKANYASQNTGTGYGGYWWLRSPGYYYSDYARYIDYDGNFHTYYVNSDYVGGVPALCLK